VRVRGSNSGIQVCHLTAVRLNKKLGTEFGPHDPLPFVGDEDRGRKQIYFIMEFNIR